MVIETTRLIIRQFTTADAAFIFELLNSPGWLQFIGDRNIKNLEDAENYLLNGPMKSYETFGFGLYMVELKEDNTPIGMCGLIKRDTLQHADIGFAFLPQYMGKGYAAEAALATVEYAKTVLELQTILAITLPDNIQSINLLKKSGLYFEKNMMFGDEELMMFSSTPGVNA